MTTRQNEPSTPSVTSRWLMLMVMCAGYFLVLLDVTIVNVALPRSVAGSVPGSAGCNGSSTGTPWLWPACCSPAEPSGDLYGHKLVGLLVFGLGSAGCGLAPRVALPAGALPGGVLVQGLGWRAVFFLNVPIVLVARVLAVRVIQESREAQARRLDRAGILLGAVLLAAVTFATIETGHAGLGLAVVAAAVVAVLALVGFLAVERSGTDPMLPLGLFRRPAFSTANAVAGTMNLGTLGLLFLLTLYLQTVQRRSPLEAGVALLPLFLPLVILVPLAGRLTARLDPRLPMAGGLVISTVGVGLLALLWPDSPHLRLLPAMLAWKIGLGLLTAAVVAAAVGAVELRRAGLDSGVNNTARQAGRAIGIAAFGAVAGPAANPGRFVNGMHVTELGDRRPVPGRGHRERGPHPVPATWVSPGSRGGSGSGYGWLSPSKPGRARCEARRTV